MAAAAPAAADGPKVKEHPDYQGYFKLLRMGMPMEQIKMKMEREDMNPDLLDTPDAPISVVDGGGAAAA